MVYNPAKRLLCANSVLNKKYFVQIPDANTPSKHVAEEGHENDGSTKTET
jgi:hypothetical protein